MTTGARWDKRSRVIEDVKTSSWDKRSRSWCWCCWTVLPTGGYLVALTSWSFWCRRYPPQACVDQLVSW